MKFIFNFVTLSIIEYIYIYIYIYKLKTSYNISNKIPSKIELTYKISFSS